MSGEVGKTKDAGYEIGVSRTERAHQRAHWQRIADAVEEAPAGG